MTVKKHIRYLFGIAFLLFLLNKFYLRLWVLENELSGLFQIFVFSLPNFSEAILGTLLLTGILMQLRLYLPKPNKMKNSLIYLAAVAISSVYVISQELEFHNLGGNNVYDPYDIMASIIGLLMTFLIVNRFGFSD